MFLKIVVIWLSSCAAIFIFFGGWWLMRYWVLPSLKSIDPETAKMCQKIAEHPLFTKGRVTFKVDVDGIEAANAKAIRKWNGIRVNGVVLNIALLSNPHLDTIVAHELGHLETGSDDQVAADAFAAQLFGPERVVQALLALNVQRDDPDRVAALLPDPIS